MGTLIVEEQTEVKTEIKQGSAKTDEVSIVVLLVKNPAFAADKAYQINILGKSMKEWVTGACEGYRVQTAEYGLEDNVAETVKPILTNSKYTVVLYSDTPLLKPQTLKEIIDYALTKKASVVKLTRGYVFETDFIRRAENIYTAEPHYFDEEDFIAAFGLKQLSMIESIMKTRILNYHMKSGVRILDLDSVTIEADVTIEKGTVIHPNNRLYGTCYIGFNVELLPNNYIKNSIIEDYSKILYSVVENSKIPPNSRVGPFEKVVH